MHGTAVVVLDATVGVVIDVLLARAAGCVLYHSVRSQVV